MIRRTGVLAVALVVLTTLAPAPVAGACAGGPNFETFEVLTKWGKKKYRPGAKVTLEVTVLRPNRRDPFDLGVEYDPPMQTPVEGAYVVSSLAVGMPPVWALGHTDADGKLHLEMKLGKDLRGPIYALTRASVIYNGDGPDCTNVEEWGRRIDYEAFVVKG